MKKKVLIICSNLGIGGFQKSLVSLLKYFDYDKYDVDLLLFIPEGIFMDLIPNNVNIISGIMPKEYFESLNVSFRKLIKDRHYILALLRLMSSSIGLIDKGYGAVFMSKFIPKLNQEYDISIDYNGQYILYYMINKITAKRKITFFHSDYKMWPYYKHVDRKYYSKVDYIVTVSDQCVKSLKTFFPLEINKIKKIENIISKDTVNIRGNENSPFNEDFDGIRLLTVGRVCKEKGIDMAIEACGYLKSQGIKIKWYAVGPIFNEQFFRELVYKYDVVNEFVFSGSTNDPYSYMRDVDIIVHPSRFEGKAVVIEEAKILKKPIVATAFSTVGNQIVNRKNGLIVEMDSMSIANGILEMINNNYLRERIIKELSEKYNGNESEINKLYDLMM